MNHEGARPLLLQIELYLHHSFWILSRTSLDAKVCSKSTNNQRNSVSDYHFGHHDRLVKALQENLAQLPGEGKELFTNKLIVVQKIGSNIR